MQVTVDAASQSAFVAKHPGLTKTEATGSSVAGTASASSSKAKPASGKVKAVTKPLRSRGA